MASLLNKQYMFCFGDSITGLSHLRRGMSNQDAMAYVTESEWTFLIVADGHGGNDYFRSERGAFFATLTIEGVLKEASVMLSEINRISDTNNISNFVATQVVERWREMVEKDIVSDPFESFPDNNFVPYGTTCIGFAIGSRYTIALQIGDGDLFLALKGGRLDKVFEGDGLDGEQTYSLCLPDAGDYLKIIISEVFPEIGEPEFVLLATDGFSKSFCSVQDAIAAAVVLRSHFSTSNECDARRTLREILTKCAMEGSCDDTTGVVLYVGSEAEGWVG